MLTISAIIVVGFAVALSGYYAHSAILQRVPGFDSGTVVISGAFFAAVLFAIAGPVLLARAIAQRAGPGVPLWRLGLGYGLVLAWAGLVGVVAIGLGAGIAGV